MDRPTTELMPRLLTHLAQLYPGHDTEALAADLVRVMRLPSQPPPPSPQPNHWDQRDVWMISYGDSVRRDGSPGLLALREFLQRHLDDCIRGVHVLPFFPYSSDDGFAVSDYLSVRPDLGSWDEVRGLAEDRRLMADLVINHCSSEHPWFRNFVARRDPGRDYFVEMDPGADLRAVVRPRTSSLLRPTPTEDGLRHVWCTFSHDQIDLDFSNPRVLVEFACIVRHYLDHGVRVFRLDAVAFLWKEIGGSALNLPQTHEIVRLFRTLVEHCEADALLITETNIPNRENLAYFGNGNEAHLIYNFSLPPLLLHTLWSGNCDHLRRWLMSMPPAQDGTTYLNFIASHDGIGLRPAEGLLSDEEIAAMVHTAAARGGEISWRALDGDVQRPYELNIALYDALQRTYAGEDGWGLQRFVCAHAIMLALEGIPAFYIHSLIGTRNDQAALAATGQARSLNRHRWDADALDATLADPQSEHARVLAALQALIRLRMAQPAFHPGATQFTLQLGAQLFGFWRQSPNRRQSVFVVNNISDCVQRLPLIELNLVVTDSWRDLISGRELDAFDEVITLAPYQSMWISNA